MKKIFCAWIALAVLLCGLAMAEGKAIRPMTPDIDLASPADGIYSVSFEPADLADGALKFTLYAEECYDIVDISTLAAGDTIYFEDVGYEVKSVERDDDVLINGGALEGGFTLHAYNGDNCWKAMMDDDYPTWTELGETTLPLADDVSFNDGWDIGRDAVIVNGAEAVAEAITGTDTDIFICYNTTVRVEDGKIVEIVRSFMP